MNVNDETLRQLRDLDAASFTTLTEDQRARAAAAKASILATNPQASEPPAPTPLRNRGRTRSRLAWGIGIVTVAAATAATLAFAATAHLGRPEPIVGTTPDTTSTPAASTLESPPQPQLTEAEAVAGCVDAWRPDPGIASPERHEDTYVNDNAITNIVNGEWQITLVPTRQVEAEWNLYCTTDGKTVTIFANGYEDWPSLPPMQATTVGSTVLLTAAEQHNTSLTTLLEGTLELSPTGCWLLNNEGTQTLLQFPYGATLSDDGTSVDVPGLGSVRAGDSIVGVGATGAAPENLPSVCGEAGQPLLVWQSLL
ncbi:hypothetical protein [Pseudoclavibacter helvolus]|uniref:hypothetical protein n=1 Tax=Pseudoclavibacter helvolus TaxID=255205 RepID=UPI0035EDE346